MYIRNHFGVSSLAQDHIIWVSVLLAAGVMGKSQNKQLATPIDSPSDLDNSAGAPTDWFLSIPPAEQEQELKRQEEREQEAHFREEKKAEDDKWWREQNQKKHAKETRESQVWEKKNDNWWHEVLKSAEKDEVLPADACGDVWYVNLGSGTWKEVNDDYWCPHCELGLKSQTLCRI